MRVMEQAIDPARVEEIAETAFGYLSGVAVAGMIYLGDELGLYRALSGAGPLTSEELAKRTGLHERWLREWLRGQAASGLVAYRGDGKYELSAEAALVLADEENPASLIGAFSDLPEQLLALKRAGDSFRTGLGFTYDAGGDAVARSVERMLGPWNKTLLVTEALPKLGVVEMLERGAKVADIGCGAGVADVAMAKRFPNSEFHAYDDSTYALQRAETNIREAEARNVFVHNVGKGDVLPADASFDLITCLDCLHDMARPDLAAAAIRRAIKPDGVWFIVDIESSADFEENLSNPMAPLMYGYSIMTCMASSASTPDGLALGTVGLPDQRMRELATAAGFSRFQRVAGLEHPFNAYYEARP